MDKYFEKRREYASFYNELEKMLYEEWVWYGIPINSYNKFNKNDAVIKDLCEYAFSQIINILRTSNKREDIFRIMDELYENDNIGNPDSVSLVIDNLMKQQSKLRELYDLALEEEKKYPYTFIERNSKLNSKLDEYLQIGENIKK